MPVRNVPKNYRNVTGVVNSTKSVEKSSFESTLERDFYELLEFDSAVLSYEVQPCVIENRSPSGSWRTYTPDVLVQYHPQQGCRATIFEVKYRADLRENWSDYKPKFQAAIRYARQHNYRFKLVTEVEIRSDYLKNVRFLLPYSRADGDDALESLLLRRIDELREADPQTLLQATLHDRWSQAKLIPSLWRLVAHGFIGTDLTSTLTMSSRIWSVAP